MLPNHSISLQRWLTGSWLSATFTVIGLLIFCATPAGARFAAPSSPQVPAITPSPSTEPSAPANPSGAKTGQYTLSHERWQKAVAYSRAGYTLYFISYFCVIAGLLLILRLRVVSRLRDFAQRATEKRWLQGLLFIPPMVVLVDLFDLPVRIYWHSLSLRYQQSIEGWGAWSWDWTKEEILQVLMFTVLGMILFALLRRSPRRWWFYFWLVTLPIALLLTIASPYIIDPLFNHFEPLADKYPAMVDSIGRLTQHAGVPIPPERMFLMEASKKTNSLNAYVAGLGPSKRVVLFDTIIEKNSPDGTLFIVGHELGHYVLGHIWQGFLMFAAGLFIAFYLMFRGLHWALARWGPQWKIYGPQDWACFAILFLLLEVISFFAAPVVNGLSRTDEHAADVYGLEVIHGIVPDSAEVAARSFQVLGEVDLSDPNPPPFITFWLYSHPPLADRLVFAHTYDPWSKGQSPKYVKK